MATADSSRKRMTKAYAALRSLGVVRKYGAVASAAVPAPNGSAFFTVKDMEGRLGLSMSSLTPRSSETFDPYFAAGIALAVLETYVSLVCHVPAASLFLLTAVPLTLDRFLLNGAVGEAILRRLDPGQREKVVRHEAGHFLVSYLLGCPVEGVVLSSLEAFSDGRFGGLAGGVAAGTSFFDDRLSAEIGRGEITRGTIDRYAAIVMAGIASEALKYDKAEGGASDEEALVRFLTSLEGRRGYDGERIKEQARRGACKAVEMLREYGEELEALERALEGGGGLADCVYAIESSGGFEAEEGMVKEEAMRTINRLQALVDKDRGEDVNRRAT